MKIKILYALMGLFFVCGAHAADMTIYYSPTCPHCHHARDYASNNFIYEYPTMNITMIDVTVPEHRALFIDVIKTCDFSSGGVPVIKIGDKCFQDLRNLWRMICVRQLKLIWMTRQKNLRRM